MEYRDPAFGVSLRFPAGWSFTRVGVNANAPALAIAYTSGRAGATGLRVLLTNQTLPGLHAWPRTVFSGVEFAYDAQPTVNAGACRNLVQGNWQREADPVTLNGQTYWHGVATGAEVSTQIDQDIYATFLAATGACLRFDLAVATSHVPGKERPRELTPREKALIQASLSRILDSVRVTPPGP